MIFKIGLKSRKMANAFTQYFLLSVILGAP
jgi:hypothetical protein